MTDNTSLTVFAQASITATGKANIREALGRDFAGTPLRVIWSTLPSYTGPAETDIVYRAASLTGTLDGYTWCDNAVTFERCDQHYVQFDSSTPSLPIICHESGHAVVLTHGAQSFPALPNDSASLGCMRLPASATTFGELNLANLNSNY
jgi:hypothetical protein